MRPSTLIDTRSPDRDVRIAELESWSDDPSAVLALNQGTEAFRRPGLPGFIAYRRSGRWLIQIGGVHAPRTARPELIHQFSRFAADTGCRVLAVQLQRADAQEHAAAGYTVNQLGASYALPLADFTLKGKPYVSLRNKISRARRAGVTVELTNVGALSSTDSRSLADLDQAWLRTKGRFTRPLRFMVGELDGPLADERRLAVARRYGQSVGYVSLSPVFGSRPGWLHDLSRRSDTAPPGVMELLVSECLRSCTEDGAAWWHFGFTPFTGLDRVLELDGSSAVVARLIQGLAGYGARVYPAAKQLDYKLKWGSMITLPDYLAFGGTPSFAGILRLMRVANLL